MMKKTNRVFYGSILVWLLGINAWAANTIEAKLDRKAVDTTGSVVLSILVVSTEKQDSEEPTFTAPDFTPSDRSSHSEMRSTYLNGNFSSEYRLHYEYILDAKKAGVFKISNISAKVGNDLLKAPDLEVTVVAGAPNASSLPSANSPNAQNPSVQPGVGTDFFVRTEVSSQNIYLGERIFISYYLYGNGTLSGVQGDKYPVLEGFLKEELVIPLITGDLRGQEVTIQGKRFVRYLLAQYSATPLKSGKMRVDPLGVKVSYLASSNRRSGDEDDLFSALFRSAIPRTERLSADLKTIEVNAVPAQGKPADYSGLVGDFSALWSLNNSSVNTGQPFSLTYKIEGNGSLSGFQWPNISLPEGLEILETKTKGSSSATGTDVKVFESSLLARKPGNFLIPGLTVWTFSPTKKSYVKVEVEPLSLQALGSVLDSESSPQSPAPDLKLTPKLSSPNQSKLTSDDFSQSSLNRVLNVLWPWGVVGLLGVLACALGLMWVRLKQKSARLGESFSRDELEKANQFLRNKRSELRAISPHEISLPALKTLSEKSSERFDQALQRALKRPLSGQSSRDVAHSLIVKFQIPDQLALNLEKRLDFRDWLKYSNQAGRSEIEHIRKELDELLDVYSNVLTAAFESSKNSQS